MYNKGNNKITELRTNERNVKKIKKKKPTHIFRTYELLTIFLYIN